MTHTHTSAPGSHHERAGHGPAPEGDSGLAELLDLDAALGAPGLATALDAASAALSPVLSPVPRIVVDLGAGTGTGTIALARRFAGALIHALDVSPGMLDHLRTSAQEAAVADRVESHLVDLDGDWPAVLPEGVDLAWAALSLHHVTEPAQVLAQVFDVLRPGGVLVVTEFAISASYDPADMGTDSADLGPRIVEALAARGYPVTADWTADLTAAGFAPVDRLETVFRASADTSAGARYLELQLTRSRDMLADDLGSHDLAAIQEVLAALADGTSRLSFTSGRAVWVAVRPNIDKQPGPATADNPDTNGAQR
ncbi:methyltransferase family protein [Homoserinimonas aerilata]|uniref:Methyltransferase family protein n=1 Tax=Homoserinimonas aerilata TaxID=1162970 RepID=A0A542Y1N7_9MICO|nr:class I SAM-dependent methyltransferase [Homoserinimonas aerilata]TQL41989.1 methyltransferase family protein [Homoserinimonas aerilata]